MRILAVVVIVVIAAACGGTQGSESQPGPTVVGNEAPPPDAAPVETVARRTKPACSGPDTECAMTLMRYYRDEMCDCAARKDKDCAERVTSDMTAWMNDAGPGTPASARVNESQAKEMIVVGTQIGECTTTAMAP
jgi:hypothetical protein